MFCLMDNLLPDIDRFLDRLAREAEQAGYGLYLVGGSVRDQIMGRETHDVYQKAFDRLLRDLKAADRQPEGSRPVG